MSETLAVAVVGAGLAGLTCAVELGRADAVVLEAELEPGGRVATRRRGPWIWEFGAAFAYNPALAPPGFASSDIELETGPILLEDGGHLHAEHEVRDCLLAGLEAAEIDAARAELAAFETGQLEVDGVSARLRARLEASFAVLHPGPLTDYLPVRQRDALLRFANRSRRGGNGELIAALRERLPCPLQVGRTVTSLDEDDDGVTLHWRDADGTRGHLRACTVVLAVPAPSAAQLLPARCPAPLRERLANWPVHGGDVAVLGLCDAQLPRFSYLVSTRPQLAALLQRRGPDPRRTLLMFYFVDVDAQAEAVSAERCLTLLAELGLGEFGRASVELFEQHRWPVIGAVIGSAYTAWDPGLLSPTPRVRLAGDWTHLCDGKRMPYGMVAAAGSGRRAAAELRSMLAPPIELNPLATSTMLALTDAGPRYIGRMDDGDVAYWGLVLAAERDPAIARQLWSVAVDGLWEYHRGYGPSASDSALVLEGLLAVGESRERLVASLRALVERYHDPQTGGFATVLGGRAPYWAGASADTTAQVLWLLAELEPSQRERIAEALAYMRATQGEDGLWPSRWFPSRTLATWFAVRALEQGGRVLGQRTQAELGRARLGLLGHQRDDGSWEGSVIDTAAALLALGDARSGACQRAAAWLRAQAIDGRWRGEPILSYWFELPSGERRMYFTVDHGRITSAWATLALRKLAAHNSA